MQSDTSLWLGTGTYSHHDAQRPGVAGCAGSAPLQFWQLERYLCAPGGTYSHHDAQPGAEVSCATVLLPASTASIAPLAKLQPLQSPTSFHVGTGTHWHHDAQPVDVG